MHLRLGVFSLLLATACAEPSAAPGGAANDEKAPVDSGATNAGSAAADGPPAPLTGGATSTAGASPADGAASSGGTSSGGTSPSSGEGGASPSGGAGANATGSSGSASGGASTATCAGSFCETFDGPQFDPRWTATVSGDNRVLIQDGALRVHYAGTRNTWAMLHAPLPAELSQTIHGALRVKVNGALPNRHAVLITAGSAGFPLGEYLEVASVGSTFQLTYVDLGASGGEDYESGGTIPRDAWFCLRFELTDVPDAARVFVDDALALEAAFDFGGINRGLVGSFDELGIGIRLWGSGAVDTPVDVLYDDLVLSSSAVDCAAR